MFPKNRKKKNLKTEKKKTKKNRKKPKKRKMSASPFYVFPPEHFKEWNPIIWGPKYWFFLHTIAFNYPLHPNTVTKKKYYELIQNLPLFLPVEEIATDFSHLLNEYPIQPYLDNRESLIKWMWFIHNKINEKLEKPFVPLKQFYENYYNMYSDTPVNIRNNWIYWRKRIGSIGLLFLVTVLLIYLYRKQLF